jgi:excisionase family DNA binding protein
MAGASYVVELANQRFQDTSRQNYPKLVNWPKSYYRRRPVAEQWKLPEVARRLGVSEKTARRYVKSGALPSVFVGGAYRVSQEDLQRFLQGAKVTPSGDSPKGLATPSQPTFNGLLEAEWRAQHLSVWKSYLSRRVEWYERVLQKSREDSFNNPFLSLDTAIQWAIYVALECTQLQNALRTEVRSYTDADSEIVGELHTLLDRLVAVEDTTDVRVKAMMDEAGLTDEDKEQRLKLIQGTAA